MLELEEAALGLGALAAAIAAEPAVAADDAVAGNEDRQRVDAAEMADRARRQRQVAAGSPIVAAN